jgi:hypothetical protein
MTKPKVRRLARAIEQARIPGRHLHTDPVQAGLFREQSVTQADIDAWLLAVPRLDLASPRAAAYVRQHNVAEKVARAKVAGRFHELTKGDTR